MHATDQARPGPRRAVHQNHGATLHRQHRQLQVVLGSLSNCRWPNIAGMRLYSFSCAPTSCARRRLRFVNREFTRHSPLASLVYIADDPNEAIARYADTAHTTRRDRFGLASFYWITQLHGHQLAFLAEYVQMRVAHDGKCARRLLARRDPCASISLVIAAVGALMSTDYTKNMEQSFVNRKDRNTKHTIGRAHRTSRGSRLIVQRGTLHHWVQSETVHAPIHERCFTPRHIPRSRRELRHFTIIKHYFTQKLFTLEDNAAHEESHIEGDLTLCYHFWHDE